MLRYMTRPLSDRTWYRPDGARQRSQFTVSWSDTLDLLERELTHLRARDVVIEVDVPERGIRNDGMLRADARASSPGVVLAFETRAHGDLLYRCDRYGMKGWGSKMDPVWQHNVRAIALTLEALRAVDRYGATETGQQYTGFKALGAGSGIGLSSGMTLTEAEAIICDIVGLRSWPDDAERRKRCVKDVKRVTHPDLNDGDHTKWNTAEQALLVMKRSGRVA